MNTNQTSRDEQTNESSQVGRVTPCAPSSPSAPAAGRGLPALPPRRKFLKLAAAALLAGAALPKSVQEAGAAGKSVTAPFTYTGGVVFNTELPGAAGELILNVYIAVDPDGTGLGTLSDVVHPEVNSHLAVTGTTVQPGNRIRFEGVVLVSNTAARVGRPFVVTGVVQQDFTSLALVLDDGTFTGKGFFVSSPMIR